jgi:hypothetical protein
MKIALMSFKLTWLPVVDLPPYLPILETLERHSCAPRRERLVPSFVRREGPKGLPFPLA